VWSTEVAAEVVVAVGREWRSQSGYGGSLAVSLVIPVVAENTRTGEHENRRTREQENRKWRIQKKHPYREEIPLNKHRSNLYNLKWSLGASVLLSSRSFLIIAGQLKILRALYPDAIKQSLSD